jgi:hypothetical protein
MMDMIKEDALTTVEEEEEEVEGEIEEAEQRQEILIRPAVRQSLQEPKSGRKLIVLAELPAGPSLPPAAKKQKKAPPSKLQNLRNKYQNSAKGRLSTNQCPGFTSTTVIRPNGTAAAADRRAAASERLRVEAEAKRQEVEDQLRNERLRIVQLEAALKLAKDNTASKPKCRKDTKCSANKASAKLPVPRPPPPPPPSDNDFESPEAKKVFKRQY